MSDASCNEYDIVFLVGKGDTHRNRGYGHSWAQSKLARLTLTSCVHLPLQLNESCLLNVAMQDTKSYSIDIIDYVPRIRN